MDKILLVLSIIAAFHTFTYARWLLKHGKKKAALGATIIVILGIALPIYNLVKAE